MKTEPYRINEEDVQEILLQGLNRTSNAVTVTEWKPLEEPGPEIIYTNNAFTQISGWTIEEVLGRSPRFQHGPDTSEATRKYIRNHLDEKKGVSTEILNYRKDGTSYWADLTIFPHTDDRKLWLAIKKDITARKLQEIKLESENRQLQSAVLTARKMIAMIAHDLRGPIAGIADSLEYLTTEKDSLDHDTRNSFIELLSTSSKSVRHLVDNILQWSVHQEYSITVEPVPCTILSMMDDVLNLYKVALQEKDITIHNAIPPKFTLFSDEHLLNAVLRNIISNAIKHSPVKGRIAIEIHEHAHGTWITVTNDGKAIFSDTEMHPLTDELLYELNKERKHHGLGLIMCRDFMIKMGGMVSIGNAPGGGTRVRIECPEKALIH